jgi:DNA-3-methyladenine glycosylase II
MVKKIEPRKHLAKIDPTLAKIIMQIKLEARKPHKRYFETLVVAIINQQLSTKAAATIKNRFVALFKVRGFPSAEQVLRKSDKSLRAAGLSFQKIGYIKSLAKLVSKGEVKFNKFAKMTDEEIIAQLILVKGIGRWTAEMFLMSALVRPDVFSHGDLGLKNAIKKWYKLEMKKHPKKYHALVESWSPHRTTAARYLWASLNLK